MCTKRSQWLSFVTFCGYNPGMAKTPGKKPMGRPRKVPSEARTVIMHVRLTGEERDVLEAAARAKSLDTSAWVRSEMLALARKVLGEGGAGQG